MIKLKKLVTDDMAALVDRRLRESIGYPAENRVWARVDTAVWHSIHEISFWLKDALYGGEFHEKTDGA